MFGAHVFSQNIELAKLTGMVLDSLAHSEPSSIKNSLRSELDAWYLQTNQVCFIMMRGWTLLTNH